MYLQLNTKLAANYHSPSQISRVLTENWVLENAYCPNCGNSKLNDFANNKPVADFFCKFCKEEYELKSKNGKLGNKIVDGAYSSMIERINSENNFIKDKIRQQLQILRDKGVIDFISRGIYRKIKG